LRLAADQQIDGGRSQQMPGVAEREAELRPDLAHLAERQRLEQLEAAVDVGVVEQRQRGLVAGEPLAVEVFRVLLLQMGGVFQQDLRQLARRRRTCDRPAEPLLHQPRHPADVVDVRVGQDQRADAARIERGCRPVALPQRLVALEHPAVDHQLGAACLDEVLRARHRLRSAEERKAWHDPQYRRSPLEIIAS
jgi:hypothetical protein